MMDLHFPSLVLSISNLMKKQQNILSPVDENGKLVLWKAKRLLISHCIREKNGSRLQKRLLNWGTCLTNHARRGVICKSHLNSHGEPPHSAANIVPKSNGGDAQTSPKIPQAGCVDPNIPPRPRGECLRNGSPELLRHGTRPSHIVQPKVRECTRPNIHWNTIRPSFHLRPRPRPFFFSSRIHCSQASACFL